MKQKENIDFDSLYKVHRDKIYRLCKVLLYNQTYLDDLYQEVIINIWKNTSKFKGLSKIETWIYRIVVNTSITFNNKQKRISIHNEEYYKDLQNTKPNNHDAIEQIHDAIMQLEDADKAIIGFFIEGFSYKEISNILGVTVSNVGVKINRIKIKLSNIINTKSI